MEALAQNLDLEMERVMERTPQGAPLLLHSCCGPCSSAVLERLAGHFSLCLYYYNPNIYPEAEYHRRLAAQRELLARSPWGKGVRFLAGEYDPERYAAAVKGSEGAGEGGARTVSPRCTGCFELRLAESARQVKALGIPLFATTMSVSPHKNAGLLHNLGTKWAAEYGLDFLPADFKKKNGYRRSVELSAQYGLYRQSYCGCRYSLLEMQDGNNKENRENAEENG